MRIVDWLLHELPPLIAIMLFIAMIVVWAGLVPSLMH